MGNISKILSSSLVAHQTRAYPGLRSRKLILGVLVRGGKLPMVLLRRRCMLKSQRSGNGRIQKYFSFFGIDMNLERKWGNVGGVTQGPSDEKEKHVQVLSQVIWWRIKMFTPSWGRHTFTKTAS